MQKYKDASVSSSVTPPKSKSKLPESNSSMTNFIKKDAGSVNNKASNKETTDKKISQQIHPMTMAPGINKCPKNDEYSMKTDLIDIKIYSDTGKSNTIDKKEIAYLNHLFFL
jgi:hypothetical protein